MVAAMNDEIEAMEALLELGADIEAKDDVSGGKKLLFSGGAGL